MIVYYAHRLGPMSFIGEVIIAATRRGHDVFSLVSSKTSLNTLIEVLDEDDDTQLQDSILDSRLTDSRKRGRQQGPGSEDDRASKKRYTTRSSGKQLPDWSKDINPQNPLGYAAGQDT